MEKINIHEEAYREELRQEYPETYKTSEDSRMLWENKIGENIKYVKLLDNSNFVFDENGLNEVQNRYMGGNISNALIIPERIIKIDNGDETTSYIDLKAILTTGEELPSIRIPLNQLESGKWFINSEWELKISFGRTANKSLQIDSIRYLSQYIERETIYKYTGFKEIKGKNVFLHNGGAVGTTENIKVDLEDEVLSRYAFTNKELDIKECVKTSFACFDVALPTITVPLLGLEFLAPLTGIIEEEGIPLGFLTWVVGPQQCKKTSLVSCMNSHYGFFDKNHSPLSFLDSIPNITAKCSKLKDVPALCDDYFPSSNRQEAAQMNKTAESLISMSADKMTGARSKSNGEMRKTHRVKGQIIATGELLPKLSQSRMSRVFIINIGKNDVDGTKLGKIQKKQEELQYTMKKYIEYIQEDIEEIKSMIKENFQTKIEEVSQKLTYRTAEMVVGLYSGLKILMEFATKVEVIEEKEKEERLKEYLNILVSIGEEQNRMVENVSPLNMLISAIEVLTNTRKLSTIEINSVPYMKPEEFSKDGFSGYYDEKDNINMIYPDILYKAVKKFYNEQNVEFPMDKSTMCKELMTNGYLYKSEKQERPQIRRVNPRNKKNETFIGILQDKIYIMHKYNEAGTIKEK